MSRRFSRPRGWCSEVFEVRLQQRGHYEFSIEHYKILHTHTCCLVTFIVSDNCHGKCQTTFIQEGSSSSNDLYDGRARCSKSPPFKMILGESSESNEATGLRHVSQKPDKVLFMSTHLPQFPQNWRVIELPLFVSLSL
jgi:hypothetical protein